MFPLETSGMAKHRQPPTTMPGRVIRARNTPQEELISLDSMSVLSGVFLLRMLAAVVDWRAAMCKLQLVALRAWNCGSASLFAICAASAKVLI